MRITATTLYPGNYFEWFNCPLKIYTYLRITGFRETNHNAIMHHQISQYGKPCKNCGKPYRTEKASFCAACGNIKEK